MNGKRKIFSNNCCRQAFTLVEVVASLMLLGTLLVGILVAHRRHAEQIRSAKVRIAAVQATDKLLAKWTEEGTWGAATASGRFEDQSDLVWQWTVLPLPELRGVGAAIGRLEVFKNGTAAPDRPLLRLDVLTHGGGS